VNGGSRDSWREIDRLCCDCPTGPTLAILEARPGGARRLRLPGYRLNRPDGVEKVPSRTVPIDDAEGQHVEVVECRRCQRGCLFVIGQGRFWVLPVGHPTYGRVVGE
jgi:hypothetical protein